jgi:hypothetical protein
VRRRAVDDLDKLLLRSPIPRRLPLPSFIEVADVTARFGAKRLRIDLVAEQVPARRQGNAQQGKGNGLAETIMNSHAG